MMILKIWGIPICKIFSDTEYHDTLKGMGALNQDNEQENELGSLRTDET